MKSSAQMFLDRWIERWVALMSMPFVLVRGVLGILGIAMLGSLSLLPGEWRRSGPRKACSNGTSADAREAVRSKVSK